MVLRSKNLIKLIRQRIGTPKTGAEIGVFRGENAKNLREAFPLCYLSLVDTWGTTHKDLKINSPEEWEKIKEDAHIAVQSRVSFYEMPSEYAALLHSDRSLDFAFIDADHSYESVSQDIELWLPKIRSGGLLSGHDFIKPDRKVGKAVRERFSDDEIILRAGRIWGVVVQ